MSHDHHGHDLAAQPSAPPDPRRWLALVLLCLAQFVLIIDITVVQVALPTIGDDLALSRGALTWVVTTYTLCFGGLMVFGGRLADVFGARRVLLTGLVLFTLASLASGLAVNGGMLVAGRAAQGVGAALLSPAALAIITTTFHGKERARALGVWAAIGGTGAAVGVLLGGVLTSGPGWEWVFFVNVPVGLLVLVVLPTTVRATTRGERKSLDVPGALAVTVGTALLIYGIVSAGDAGWGGAGTLVPVAVALACYVGFVVIERRAQAPLMRARTLGRRPVVSGTFLMLLASGLMLGLFFLTSLYVQHVLEFSALATGLLFLPIAVAITAGAQLGAHLIGKVGGRAVAVAGFALSAAGAALLTQVSADGGAYTAVLPGFLVAAFGIGPLFVTATTTTLANVPQHEAGVASGVVNTFHELGGSFGVAVVSTVAASSIGASAPGVDGFVTAFVVCAVVAVVAGAVSLGLVPAGKPAGMVGHGHGH